MRGKSEQVPRFGAEGTEGGESRTSGSWVDSRHLLSVESRRTDRQRREKGPRGADPQPRGAVSTLLSLGLRRSEPAGSGSCLERRHQWGLLVHSDVEFRNANPRSMRDPETKLGGCWGAGSSLRG